MAKIENKEFKEEYRVEETIADLLKSVKGKKREKKPLDKWYSYEKIDLSDLQDGGMYGGKPVLTTIERRKFKNEETGEEEERIQCYLVLEDEEVEEYLPIRIKLKKFDDRQEGYVKRSKLYPLVAGLMDWYLKEDWSEENDIIDCNLSDLRKILSKIGYMEIEAIEVTDSTFSYFTYKITKIKE